ncbi:phage/plasmid replication protein, partial [Pseudomonas syringae]|uniref:phage/plasmid replication domain-containing protein n=2 Tax=Pseudomonas syringae TaxID=317 RepID=UPI0021807C24
VSSGRLGERCWGILPNRETFFRVSQGICSGEASANATMVYVFMWMEGQSFDLSKSAVKVHRARLRKIGLDIGKPYAGEVVSSSF